MDDTTRDDGTGPAPAPSAGHWICLHDGYGGQVTWTEEVCETPEHERMANEQRRIARDMAILKSQVENEMEVGSRYRISYKPAVNRDWVKELDGTLNGIDGEYLLVDPGDGRFVNKTQRINYRWVVAVEELGTVESEVDAEQVDAITDQFASFLGGDGPMNVYVIRTAYDVRICRTEQGADLIAKEMEAAVADSTFKWVQSSRETIEEV